MGKYAKFVTAIGAFVVVLLGHYVGVTSWIYAPIVSLLGALGVYTVPNQ